MLQSRARPPAPSEKQLHNNPMDRHACDGMGNQWETTLYCTNSFELFYHLKQKTETWLLELAIFPIQKFSLVKKLIILRRFGAGPGRQTTPIDVPGIPERMQPSHVRWANVEEGPFKNMSHLNHKLESDQKLIFHQWTIGMRSGGSDDLNLASPTTPRRLTALNNFMSPSETTDLLNYAYPTRWFEEKTGMPGIRESPQAKILSKRHLFHCQSLRKFSKKKRWGIRWFQDALGVFGGTTRWS